MGKLPDATTLRMIQSRRLNLIAATTDLIKKSVEGRELLAEALDVSIPESWPPDLYGPRAMQFALAQLDDASEQGWSFWYLLSKSLEVTELMGICGFKGRPDEAGLVEISYSVLSQFCVNGYATEAVTRLVRWAFSHQNVTEVCAETLPHLQKSIRVMEKNGFTLTGPGSEHGVVRYAVQRPDQR